MGLRRVEGEEDSVPEYLFYERRINKMERGGQCGGGDTQPTILGAQIGWSLRK